MARYSLCTYSFLQLSRILERTGTFNASKIGEVKDVGCNQSSPRFGKHLAGHVEG